MPKDSIFLIISLIFSIYRGYDRTGLHNVPFITRQNVYCQLRVWLPFPFSLFSLFFSFLLFYPQTCFRTQLLSKCPPSSMPRFKIFLNTPALQQRENPRNSFAMQINAREGSTRFLPRCTFVVEIQMNFRRYTSKSDRTKGSAGKRAVALRNGATLTSKNKIIV